MLFLPNAPYIISDLKHTHHNTGWLQLYDATVISCFALVSLVVMSFSIRDMLLILRPRKPLLVLIGISILCGFGIYLGRYLRWNSWDIIQNPVALIEDIRQRIFHPIQYRFTWMVTLFYGAISLLSYCFINKLLPRRTRR